MHNKYKWQDAVEDINWEVHDQALKAINNNNQRTIIKFIHEWLPVNSHNTFPSTTEKCPIRQNENKTHTHLLTCKHNASANARKQVQDKLIEEIKQLKGDPIVTKMIYQYITTDKVNKEHYHSNYHNY